jgi:hypothetical protein
MTNILIVLFHASTGAEHQEDPEGPDTGYRRGYGYRLPRRFVNLGRQRQEAFQSSRTAREWKILAEIIIYFLLK